MDHFFHPQTPKHSTANKYSKKRLTQDQVKLLEISFTTNKKLDPERKLRLAKELGVPPRQVAIWYQNKRARWKTQSLEYDYGALQVKLESAMAEKRQVEKEVERLRGELKRAQEMLNIGVNSNNNNSSCDEGGSSSLHDGDFHHWVNHGGGDDDDDDHGVLQLEELYACFVGGDGGCNNWG